MSFVGTFYKESFSKGKNNNNENEEEELKKILEGKEDKQETSKNNETLEISFSEENQNKIPEIKDKTEINTSTQDNGEPKPLHRVYTTTKHSEKPLPPDPSDFFERNLNSKVPNENQPKNLIKRCFKDVKKDEIADCCLNFEFCPKMEKKNNLRITFYTIFENYFYIFLFLYDFFVFCAIFVFYIFSFGKGNFEDSFLISMLIIFPFSEILFFFVVFFSIFFRHFFIFAPFLKNSFFSKKKIVQSFVIVIIFVILLNIYHLYSLSGLSSPGVIPVIFFMNSTSFSTDNLIYFSYSLAGLSFLSLFFHVCLIISSILLIILIIRKFRKIYKECSND